MKQKEVKATIDDHDSLYAFKNFRDYQYHHLESHLKSLRYQNYRVLCRLNMNFPSGWIVGPSIQLAHYNLRNQIFEIDSRQGGANRFCSHLIEHEKFLSSYRY